MKIIATARIRDDEDDIADFCRSYYQWADEIILADGGSQDRTVEIAQQFPKTRVLDFHEYVRGKNNISINPQNKHFNFLARVAEDAGADWIIFDDSDCYPNYEVKAEARRIMSDTEYGAIFIRRVYFWGTDQIFPKLHEPDTSLWAWKPSVFSVRASEENPWRIEIEVPPRSLSLHLEFPYCLLHYPWRTPASTQAKIRRYRKSGQQTHMKHPKEFGGPLAAPAPFMRMDPA